MSPQFHALVPGAEPSAITVVIYSPVMSEHGPACRFTIRGADIDIDSEMVGGDRLGAILHSFYAVRQHLEQLPYDVTWQGTPRILDLPKRMPYFGLHFMRHCEDLLDEEYRAAADNMAETKRLWGDAPGKRYEDCEGYKLKLGTKG